MLENPTFMCIDAGGENCPCSLAESGNCIVCGRLSGNDCSGCKWHGVCIYNEYIQNGKRIKKNRKDFRAEIVKKAIYNGDTLLLGLKTGKGFSLKCYSPGSYLFLRREKDEQFFNVPISVMRSDLESGIVYLLVKCISAKTRALLDEESFFMVRGPYKNGIFGIDSINDIKKIAKSEGRRARLLIVSRGTGIAPAIKLMQYMEDKCEFSVFFDLANVDEGVYGEFVDDLNVRLRFSDLTDQRELLKLEYELISGEYDGLAVFASDYYIELINGLADEVDFGGKRITSNNFNICCGEGICGACSVAGKNGETIKMCKCRLSGEEVLKRKVIYR